MNANSPTIRYVALGDSYTVGTGASPQESWPAVLTRHLQSKDVAIELSGNLAVSGWTAREVINFQLPEFKQLNPTFASLLIGTNDWVQGADAKTFEENLNLILKEVLTVLPKPTNEHLFLVTIPDFSVMPQAELYTGGRDISSGLAEFNEVIKREGQSRGILVVDIFDLSRQLGADPATVSRDGLHPSATGYARWEQTIYPEVYELLQRCCLSREKRP